MTNQTLTRYEPAPPAPVVSSEQVDLVRRTVAKDATDAELNLYLYDCQRHGVHPLDRLLHFTKRGGKYTPITSIDLLRSRAADTGDLAGIDDAQYNGEPGKADFTATVTVYRIVQGQRCPFSATARWSEYKPADGQDHMWRKMPFLMLAKCSEALALRKAFPRQLAGLYASEELDQANNNGGSSYSAPALPPAPPANRTTGEIVDAPAAGEAPTCPICGAIGKPSRYKEGYYCANKRAHDGKFYDIPWADEEPPPLADAAAEDWDSEFDQIES